MANPDKKDFTAQTFKLRTDLVKKLDRYRKETGVSKTFAVERAIEEYLAKMMPET